MKTKKHKKEKKRKKQKKEKQRQKDEYSSEESSEAEMEWVESSSAAQTKSRDQTSPDVTRLLSAGKVDQQTERAENDWLESPFLTAATSQSDIRRQREAERNKEKEKNNTTIEAGQSARELNPYWKNGGTGLPEEKEALPRHSAPPTRRAGHGVDGGVSWLKKSYQRAVEQARDSGRPVNVVVAERWGSVAEYERLLAEATEESRGAHSRPPRGARGPPGPPPGWRRGGGEDDGRGNRYPQEGDGRRNRRDGNEEGSNYREQGSQRGFMKPGDRDDNRDRDKASSRDRDKASSRDRDRDHDRDRDRYRDRDRDRDANREAMRSRFKRPGESEDNDGNSCRDRTSSSYSRGSSSRDWRKDEDFPSWKKSGFKKPGEDGESSSSRGNSRPSSSSSGGWKKPGFQRPGDDRMESATGRRSSPSSSSSSSGGWRKPGSKKPDDERISTTERASWDPPPLSSSLQPSLSSSYDRTSKRSGRRRSDSDGDNSDDARSSGSASSEDEEKRRREGRERRREAEEATRGEEKEDKKEEKKEEERVPVKILSDTEMNKLGAKMVKAEIMGNEALAAQLKEQIEAARQARIAHKTALMEGGAGEAAAAAAGAGGDKSQKRSREVEEGGKEEVILTRTDRSGQSWPLDEETAAPDSGKRKRKKNIVTHDKGGERDRYFADDDDVDLETMVRRERMGTSDDHNRLLNKVASKKLALLDSEFNTLDEMFVSSAAKAESKSAIEARERSKAIYEHQKTMATLSKCPFCIESAGMQKHLIIALGLKVYLCVAQTRPISEGQCYIVPMQHSVASTALDEDIWAEIQVFRKGLTRMFQDHEMDVVFMETCMNPKKKRHMCIEVIPIPQEVGEMVPIYFKKAIQESESEWTQNKKLIDLRQKDIRHSVPRGFPFFSVDFGLDGGFAHVIEDELTFPHFFGKEVVGGLLDVEPRLWRHPPKENFEDQSKRVLQLTQWWKPFDWTQKIDRDKN